MFTFCWSEVYYHQRDDETRIYALPLFTILNMYLLRVLTHIIRLIVPHRVFPQLCTMEHLFIFFIAFALMDEMCFTFGIHDIGILLYFTKAGKRSRGKNVQKTICYCYYHCPKYIFALFKNTISIMGNATVHFIRYAHE